MIEKNHVLLALVGFVLVHVARVILRRFFNPLNQFPGPELAKWTQNYMAYYEVIKQGAWIEQLQELHRLYGPIVRVGPNELHFSDPSAYGDIYSTNSKFIKDSHLYDAFPAADSLFCQTDPGEVSTRKPLINPFFSKQTVLSLKSIIRSTVDKLIHQLVQNHSPNQTPANLNLALRSTTFDVITTYCFAKSIDAVSYPGFHNVILRGMDTSLAYIPLAKHFRIVQYIIKNIPSWSAPMLDQTLRSVVEQMKDIEDMVDKVLRNPDAPDFPHRTIFHSLLDGAQSGEYTSKRRSKSVTRQWLKDEGLILRFAGSDTVSSACLIGCRCILANPEVLGKLVKELDRAWPDKNVTLPYEILEKLPYLTAVIKESLRLSHGTTGPLPRIVPAGGATIAGHFVPEGTTVAIANSFVHLHPSIFSEPEQFKPERWLQPDSQNLDKYLVAFGKGPRSCIGINLAWCELYLIMGSIFRKLDLRPTIDVRTPWRVKDYFIPVYDEDILNANVEERLQ